MPLGAQEEENWGANANCYAYACNCANPTVGNPPRQARPGVAGGAPPVNNGDVTQLTAGLIADGGQQVAGTPMAIPNPPPNHYLIAMITSNTGFHFMRRDEFTKRWSWKDANHGTVKYNVMHAPTSHYVYINDTNLHDLLVANRNDYVWAYNGMVFRSFFAIPNNGLVVNG